jgi:hypothetical protein
MASSMRTRMDYEVLQVYAVMLLPALRSHMPAPKI